MALMIIRASVAPALLLASGWQSASAQDASGRDTSLVGLWHAKVRHGPDARGALRVERDVDGWRGSLAGHVARAHVSGDSITLAFPSAGTFTGQLAPDRTRVVGHWKQARLLILNVGGSYATPMVLSACGRGCYTGRIDPLEDRFTFYMEVKARPDGTLGVFLRNPERNQGRIVRADNMLRRGDTLYLRSARDSIIMTGTLRGSVISGFAFRGSTFEFHRVHPDSFTFYYPRGRPAVDYSYRIPPARNDGWTVARPRDVGLSEEKLASMVRSFANASLDSTGAYRPHAILIARNARLVLEEYFHGEHGDAPHDTRSASKTLLNVVIGAAMQAGMKVGPETPVYATLGQGAASLDSRKRAMRLRHLLTMSSGLDCDDNGQQRPGNEDVITNQTTNPDWTRIILDLDMVRDPGAQAVYCSINPYLGGEVLSRATGRSFEDLAWRLVAEPLQMGRYHLALSPLGVAYNGGGAYLLPRDLLKLAQLYANGGSWRGRRIVSEAWVRESVQPRVRIGRPFRQTAAGAVETPEMNNYGYLWWTTEFEHQGRRYLAHHASGNGGQFAIFFPELALVVATLGGNYADVGGFFTLRELIPKHILPALSQPHDP